MSRLRAFALFGMLVAPACDEARDARNEIPPDWWTDGGRPEDVLAGCTATYDPTIEDSSQPVLVFDVDRLQVPSGASPTVVDGLDVDGRSTTSTSDPAGCFVRDTKATSTSVVANVDDAFASMAPKLWPYGLDASAAFQRAVSAPDPALAIRIEVLHYNRQPLDPCVGVRLHVGPTTGQLALVGEAVTGLVDGRSRVMSGFPPLPLALRFVGEASCVPYPAITCPSGRPQGCEAVVPVVLRDAHLRLNVQPATAGGFVLATNQPNPPGIVADVTNPTLLAGILDWPSSSPGPSPEGTAAYALEEALCQLGHVTLWPDVRAVAEGKRDLRLETPDSPPSSCSGTSPATSNVNAMSIGLYLGDVE